jgi:hypothetical protein
LSQLSVAALHSHPVTKGKGEFEMKCQGRWKDGKKYGKKDGRKMTEAGSNETPLHSTPDGKEKKLQHHHQI